MSQAIKRFSVVCLDTGEVCAIFDTATEAQLLSEELNGGFFGQMYAVAGEVS